mgnify:CR=1 FL=1
MTHGTRFSHVITTIVMVAVTQRPHPGGRRGPLAELDGVSEVYSVAGNVDLIAIVRVREFDQIADVLAGQINKLDGVLDHRDPRRVPGVFQARPVRRVRHRLRGVTVGKPTDWVDWHGTYDDPTSSLSHRLRPVVRGHIRDWLNRTAPAGR